MDYKEIQFVAQRFGSIQFQLEEVKKKVMWKLK